MPPKRYIILCPGCDTLDEVARDDAVVCSARCRVRMHRHPELAVWNRPEYRSLVVGIPPSFNVKVAAFRVLCPTRIDEVAAGTLKIQHPRHPQRLTDEAERMMEDALYRIAEGETGAGGAGG